MNHSLSLNPSLMSLTISRMELFTAEGDIPSASELPLTAVLLEAVVL